MSGTKVFVDTNIILYLLSGDETIAEFLDGRHVYLSFITELELMGYSELNDQEYEMIVDFLDHCRIIGINSAIKKRAIALRRLKKVKLPDAIVISSAQYMGLPLMSADKAFQQVEDLDLIYYER